MNFDLSEGDLVQQHELFKQVCAQNINTLDDADDQIFDEKEHTFQTVIEKDAERNSSSDSEEGDDPLMEAECKCSSLDLYNKLNILTYLFSVE